jgi:hypothetical protein
MDSNRDIMNGGDGSLEKELQWIEHEITWNIVD